MGWKGQILMISFMLTCILFSAVSVIMIVGMIPTLVAGIMDRSEGRIRTITIGAMNFAGCAPFMFDIFKKGNDMPMAISYILEPQTIVVMYFAAAMGYIIDWAMTGIVSSIMVQRGKSRITSLHKAQKEMIERWGLEVNGTIPLDEYGFPVEVQPAKAEETKGAS